MKFLKLIITLVIVIESYWFSPILLNSQPLTDSTVNFFSLSSFYDEYYDSLLNVRGADSMAGTGYKDYLRWKWFYFGRHGVNGELDDVWNEIQSYHENYSEPQGYSDFSDWHYAGPIGFPLKHNNASSHVTGKGMALTIWIGGGDHNLMYAGSHHGGLWKTTDGGENWHPLHDNDDRIHGVNNIAVDPEDNDIIYITCNNSLADFSNYSAGLFKSTDGGATWTLLNTGIPFPTAGWSHTIRRITIHPHNPNVLFLITYRTILKSEDKGTSWDTIFYKPYFKWGDTNSTNYDWHNGIFDLEVDPNNDSIYYIAGSEFFRIKDSLSVIDTLNLTSNVFSPGMDTLKPMHYNPHRSEISLHENFPDKIWFCYVADYNDNGKLVTYTKVIRSDSLESFTLLDSINHGRRNPGTSGDKLEFSVSPSDENTFYLGGIGIYRLDNTTAPDSLVYLSAGNYPGNCWAHADIREMLVLSDGDGHDSLYTANDAGISIGTMPDSVIAGCDENSFSWRHACTSADNGLNITEFYGIGLPPVSENIVAGGCQDLSDMIFLDDRWINFGSGDGSEVEFDPDSANIFYFTEWQSSSFSRTNSYGEYAVSLKKLDKSSIFMPLELDPTDHSILYIGGYEVFKCEGVNNFQDSITTTELKDFRFPLTDIEVVKPDAFPKTMYVSTGRGYYSWNHPPDSSQYDSCIYRSYNQTDWTDISRYLPGCLNGFISDIEVNPDDANQLWVSFAVYSKNSGQEKKLFTSDDGGSSWQDFSQGLPSGLPVFQIRFIQEYDFLLAATDVGIFKRSLSDTTWYPFNNNLPKKIVTDLEVNPATNTIYASTYGRGLWKTPIICNFESEPWIINDDLAWEKDTILQSSIVISDSSTVRISGCNIFMPTQAKIVVSRGATLILDGCKLTSACNNLWWGIEVWGDSRTMQASNLQGRVEMMHGAIIEKARRAIFCGKNIESTYPDWDYTGGIIVAEDAVFKNNRYGVQLWTYSDSCESRFSKCDFITTELLADGSYPEYFMTLVQVHGVKISSCNFEHQLEGVNDFKYHGRGIYGLDAGFDIYPSQEGALAATFKKLDYGIMALKVFEDQRISIHDAKFESNITGFYGSALQLLELYFNDFYININPVPLGRPHCGGVFLDHCSGFVIEENSFFRPPNLGNEEANIGLTISNSGEDYNEIYKNTFDNLYVGTLAQYVNRDTSNVLRGLKLNCNVYNLNDYDIDVTGYPGWAQYGISKWQGSSTNPAGNLFSQLGKHPASDFDNDAPDVTYFHHEFIGQDTANNKWVPMYFTASVLLNETNKLWDDTTCSSRLGSLRDLIHNKDFYEISLSNSDSLSLSLQNLTDGGNTEALNSEIILSEPEDALELRSQLLSDSPFLSDTVLISSAEKEDVLSPAMVKEIMVANPQSAKSDKVMEAIENRDNPLPDYMIAEIMEGQDSLAQKENLEADLSYWELQKGLALNRLIAIYRSDTNGMEADSILNLLQEQNTLSSEYRMAMFHLIMNDTLSSINRIDSIPVEYDLCASQIISHEHWADLVDIFIELKRDSLNFSELDSAQLSTFEEISYHDDLPGCLSRNLLHHLGILETGPYYLLPEDQFKSIRIKPESKIDPPPLNQSLIRIYPNPAKNYLVVEYINKDLTHNASLVFFTSEGRMVHKQILEPSKSHIYINTKDWHCGLYFYCCYDQSSPIANGKIVIIK